MSADEPVKPAKTDGTDWMERIWNFLTSLKLGLLDMYHLLDRSESNAGGNEIR
jgi:hypothetical protein